MGTSRTRNDALASPHLRMSPQDRTSSRRASAARISAHRIPGSVLKPTIRGSCARDLGGDPSDDIEVLQDNGELGRIVGLDITRAPEASGARVTDRIQVIPTDRHAVPIHSANPCEGCRGCASRPSRSAETTAYGRRCLRCFSGAVVITAPGLFCLCSLPWH